MYPWFSWNGIRTDERENIWISELPPIVRAQERVKRVVIPGKEGDVTQREGKDIYNAYEKQCIVTVKTEEDYAFLLGWLRGSGEAVFSNEPDRAYTADIVSVEFAKDGNSFRRGTIIFHCQPYKKRVPDDGQIEIEDGETIYNPGDVEAKPIIEIEGTGEAVITIGEYTMTISNVPEWVKIDCDAEIIIGPEGWDGEWEGKFIRIPTGQSDTAVSGCTATITPNWRWV